PTFADQLMNARASCCPFFGCRFRKALPQQHVPEVVDASGDEIHEGIEVTLAQGQDGTMDVVSLHVAIPADDLERIRELFGPEHHAGKLLGSGRYTHTADHDGHVGQESRSPGWQIRSVAWTGSRGAGSVVHPPHSQIVDLASEPAGGILLALPRQVGA